MMTLYGINNCDSCRKARRWLEEHDIEFRFADIRQEGLQAGQIDDWQRQTGWQALLNTRSATWRSIPAAEREDLGPEASRSLILAYPTVMKRPVLDTGREVLIGFDAEQYASLAR